MTRRFTEETPSTTENFLILKSTYKYFNNPPCASVSPFSKEDLKRFVME